MTRPDGSVDIALWQELGTSISLDTVLECEEINLVARSWHAAREANLKSGR